ncbi:hypothetical protein B0H13DRAFT_1861600 [Mycena leptocephala]|nr:hypothetical protein B0H13DRAFT_1861600 [Mycena leptocephala]
MRQSLIPIWVTMLISGATSLPTQKNNNGRDNGGTLEFEEDVNLTIVQAGNGLATSSSTDVSASAPSVSHLGSYLAIPFPPVGGATLTSKSASVTLPVVLTSVTAPAAASTCPPSVCQSPTESELPGVRNTDRDEYDTRIVYGWNTDRDVENTIESEVHKWQGNLGMWIVLESEGRHEGLRTRSAPTRYKTEENLTQHQKISLQSDYSKRMSGTNFRVPFSFRPSPPGPPPSDRQPPVPPVQDAVMPSLYCHLEDGNEAVS